MHASGGHSSAAAPDEKRMCHACHTTTTSQWRYGRTDNVLLCNACGIRWKRKNKAVNGQEKIKPGPKRSRSQATTPDHGDGGGRSHPSAQPYAGRLKPRHSDGVEAASSSHSRSHHYDQGSSSDIRRHHSQSRHVPQRTYDRSKMDLRLLMSPVDEVVVRPRAKHQHSAPPRGSPIAIQNLLNMPEDRKIRRPGSSSNAGPRYN